jgi:Flp pilus assembly protein TadG
MVEFALVAPLLFLFFFSALEFCRVAMIRHTADNAVYEGARIGIIPGATAAQVRQEAEQILNSLGLSTFDVRVTPGKIEKDTRQVTVSVEVPLDGNSFVPNQFVGGRTIERQLTMRREGIRSDSS